MGLCTKHSKLCLCIVTAHTEAAETLFTSRHLLCLERKAETPSECLLPEEEQETGSSPPLGDISLLNHAHRFSGNIPEFPFTDGIICQHLVFAELYTNRRMVRKWYVFFTGYKSQKIKKKKAEIRVTKWLLDTVPEILVMTKEPKCLWCQQAPSVSDVFAAELIKPNSR